MTSSPSKRSQRTPPPPPAQAQLRPNPAPALDITSLGVLLFVTITSIALLFASVNLIPVYSYADLNPLAIYHLFGLLTSVFLLAHAGTGWYGHFKGNQLFLEIYDKASYVSVGIMVIVTLYNNIMLFSGLLYSDIETSLTNSFKNYEIIALTSEQIDLKQKLDSLQKVLVCCGAKGPFDYEKREFVTPIACGSSNRGCIGAAILIESLLRTVFTLETLACLYLLIKKKFYHDL